MRRKKLWLTVGVALSLLVFAWIPTGGVVLVVRDDASGGSSVQKVARNSTMVLRVSHPERVRGIPLVFLYLTDGPGVFVFNLTYLSSSISPNAAVRFEEFQVLEAVDGRLISSAEFPIASHWLSRWRRFGVKTVRQGLATFSVARSTWGSF